MVSVRYLIDRPAGPAPLATFVNRRLIPPAIDAAAAVESTVYELGEQVRARPATALLSAAGIGFVIGATLFSLGRSRLS